MCSSMVLTPKSGRFSSSRLNSLRSTGTSFCYNVGRFVAASGPFTIGLLQARLKEGATTMDAKIEAFRNAACYMSVIFLIGIVAVSFLPETKGKPLPED